MKVLCRCSDEPYTLDERHWEEEGGICPRCGATQVPLVSLDEATREEIEAIEAFELPQISGTHEVTIEEIAGKGEEDEDQPTDPRATPFPAAFKVPGEDDPSSFFGFEEEIAGGEGTEIAGEGEVFPASPGRYRELAHRHIQKGPRTNFFLSMLLGCFVMILLVGGLLVTRRPELLQKLVASRPGEERAAPPQSPELPPVPSAADREAVGELLAGREAFFADTERGYERAIRHFHRAFTLRPDLPQPRALLAEAHAMLHLEYGKGDLLLAKTLSEKGVAEHPGAAASYRARAAVEFARKEIEQALVDIDRALFLDRFDALAYTLYGDLLRNVPQGDAFAISAYDQALLLNPRITRARYGLAMMLHAEKRYEEALRHARKLLELPGDTTRARSLLETIEESMKRKETSRATEKPPHSPPSNGGEEKSGSTPRQGAATSRSGAPVAKRPLHASRPGARAVRRSPRPRSALPRHLRRGRRALTQGDFAAAQQEFERALRLAPRNSEASTLLGFAMFRQGKYREARKFFRETLRNNPNYADAYRGLGMIYEEKGNRPKAIEAYQTYLLLFPMGPHVSDVQRRIARISRSK